jgi:hypothetical protein
MICYEPGSALFLVKLFGLRDVFVLVAFSADLREEKEHNRVFQKGSIYDIELF